jgi:hypothetical protein
VRCACPFHTSPAAPTPLQVYKKGQEIADDLRDKYETSDHPFVHKVEDVKERLFSESGAAQVRGGAGPGGAPGQCGGWGCGGRGRGGCTWWLAWAVGGPTC